MRRAIRLLWTSIIMAVVGALLALGALFLAWGTGAPLDHLPGPAAHRESLRDEPVLVDGHARLYRHVILEDQALGTVRFTVSLPARSLGPGDRLPAIILLGGMRKGWEQVEYVPDIGNNAFVAFEYPTGRKITAEAVLGPRATPAFRQRILRTPGQITAMLDWLATQGWIDDDRVVLVGASLGSIFAPAAQNLAQARGATVPAATIFGYGGADLAALLEVGLGPDLPGWVSAGAASALERLLRPIDPSLHLPNLKGQFLILSGGDDGLIPKTATEALRRLTPDPKTILDMPGAHPGDPGAATATAIAAVRDWLIARGLANPW